MTLLLTTALMPSINSDRDEVAKKRTRTNDAKRKHFISGAQSNIAVLPVKPGGGAGRDSALLYGIKRSVTGVSGHG
jgi:hypothetical protein